MLCFAAPELTPHDCSDFLKKVSRQNLHSRKLAVGSTVVLPISKDSGVFLQVVGAAIFFWELLQELQNLAKRRAHLLTSCTRRIPAYMMRLRYFRNHDKAFCKAALHA